MMIETPQASQIPQPINESLEGCLGESFGQKCAADLSSLLRSMVAVKLTSIDQLTYSEFIRSLDNPTCFNIISAKPLRENLVLDINPSIIFPMIDRLLGGVNEKTRPIRRPMTAIELRLVSRISNAFLTELKRALENVLKNAVKIDLAVIQTESNPQLIQIAPPNEVVVVVCLEVSMADARGMVNLCIPHNAFEQISGKSIRNTQVEIEVRLAQTQMQNHELASLRVGDVIRTEKSVRSPLMVSIDGIPKYWGRPGVYKGFSAIQIEDIIDAPIEAISQS